MLHMDADKDATIAAILLLGRVRQIEELERLPQQRRQSLRRQPRDVLVAGVEGVVVEGDAVDDGDEE